MNDCSITVINTIDECPRYASYSGSNLNTNMEKKIKTEYFSIGYVFRIVNTRMDYCNNTIVMMNYDSLPYDNHSSKQIEGFVKNEYHKNLDKYYISKFGLLNN